MRLKVLGSTVIAAFLSVGFLVSGVGQAIAQHVQCGDSVAQDVTLDSDLTNCASTGLNVVAAGVTVNLNGHTITGAPQSQSGINDSAGYGGLRVLGPGRIFGFGFGVFAQDLRNGLVRSISFRSQNDVWLSRGSDNVVENNRFLSPIGPSGVGVAILVSDRNIVRNNSFSGVGLGIWVDSACRGCEGFQAMFNRIENNALTDSGDGVVVGCSFCASPAYGNVVGDNRTSGNSGDGMRIEQGSAATTVSGNRADRNGNDGIKVASSSSTLTSNRASFNGNYGIESLPGTDGGGNRAKNNGNPAQCLNVACGPPMGKR
jgi:parallel beta-helix repeat protein